MAQKRTAEKDKDDVGGVSADAPTPLDPNFRIELPGFEGPLDLLLHLIRKHELNVEDLPVAFVTEKYLEYLSLLEELNLDVASEYLVMAATLVYIKSKTLLPRAPEEAEEEAAEDEEEDPRAELIRHLLEYQKYKQAAAQLGARGIAGRDVFSRGGTVKLEEQAAPLQDISIFKLIDAFSKLVKKRQGHFSLEVDAERISIQERIGQIVEGLKRNEQISLVELFDGYATTYDLVVTFLALLEMTKMRMVRVFQSGHDEQIFIEYRALDAESMGPTYGDVAISMGENFVRPPRSEFSDLNEEDLRALLEEEARDAAIDAESAWEDALAAVGDVDLEEDFDALNPFGDEEDSEEAAGDAPSMKTRYSEKMDDTGATGPDKVDAEEE